MQNHAKEKAEKRKEKKLKESRAKNKRRRVSSSSSSSSSDSEDDAILEKFISLIRNPDGGKEAVSNEKDTIEKGKKSEEKKHEKKGKKHHHKHHHSKKEVEKSANDKSPARKPQSRTNNNSLQHRARDRKSHSRSRSPEGRSRRPHDRNHYDSRPRAPPPRYRSPPHGGSRPRPRRTAEEMEALRAQMAADAKERDAERRQRFEQHIAETAREERVEGEARITHGASFLRKLTLDHVASTSVEEVVQRNAKSRQRGGMDKNFLRR